MTDEDEYWPSVRTATSRPTRYRLITLKRWVCLTSGIYTPRYMRSLVLAVTSSEPTEYWSHATTSVVSQYWPNPARCV
jgi:hypothetical protein